MLCEKATLTKPCGAELDLSNNIFDFGPAAKPPITPGCINMFTSALPAPLYIYTVFPWRSEGRAGLKRERIGRRPSEELLVHLLRRGPLGHSLAVREAGLHSVPCAPGPPSIPRPCRSLQLGLVPASPCRLCVKSHDPVSARSALCNNKRLAQDSASSATWPVWRSPPSHPPAFLLPPAVPCANHPMPPLPRSESKMAGLYLLFLNFIGTEQALIMHHLRNAGP